MTLRVLIVDDESLARSRLRTLLGDCASAEVGAEAATAAEALDLLQRESFDLALLDIHMPGADGMQLAERIKALPRAPAVVFVTAHAGHAVQAFELEAVDYLTKPVRLERLQAALQKVERMIKVNSGPEVNLVENSDEVLVIHDRGRTERVPLAEVLYLKAELKYITVRTAARSHIFDGSLSELEARHPGVFIRIHRNALVARRAMRALEKSFDAVDGEGWAVRLQGLDEALMVSRRQLAAVREAIASGA